MFATRRKEKPLPTAVLQPPHTRTVLPSRSNQLSACSSSTNKQSSIKKSSLVTDKLSLYVLTVTMVGALGYFTNNFEVITNLERRPSTTEIAEPTPTTISTLRPKSKQQQSDSVLLPQQLEGKKKQLELAIKKESLNIPKPIKPLPPPNYDEEIAAVKKAKIELNLIESTPKPNFQFTLPELRGIQQPSLVEKQLLLNREIVRASSNYHQALAKLNAARSAYQHQQNLHSLALSRYEAQQQQHQYKLESLKQQLQNIEKELP